MKIYDSFKEFYIREYRDKPVSSQDINDLLLLVYLLILSYKVDRLILEVSK